MKTFEILYSKDGIAKKHRIVCKNRQEAIAYCHRHQLKIIRISLQDTAHTAIHPSPSHKDLIILFHQFSILLESGIPIYELLKNMSTHGYNPKITALVQSIFHGIQEGKTLYESLLPYKQSIGELGMALIEIGEKSGNLCTAFSLLSQHMKNNADNQAKIKHLLIYPAFLLVALILALVIIVGYLLPQFQELFESFDKNLPPLTEFLFSLNRLHDPQILSGIVLSIIAIGILIFLAWRTPAIRLKIDAYLLKAPLLGSILTSQQLFFYFSTLRLLLSMGFALDQTLKLCVQVLSNTYLKEKFSQVLVYLQKGDTLEGALQKIQILSPLELELFLSVEMSGEIDRILNIIITLHHESFTQKQAQVLALIEPCITLIMATFVLILALGIFIPLWELNHVF